jgi:outer membrane receptor protein involved in Fe transport
MGGFGILNLRAGLHARTDNWNISVYANNVLDRRYYSGLGQSALWVGAPVIAGSLPRDASRYFGVGINTRF